MNSSDSTQHCTADQGSLAETLRYARADLGIFPVRANKTPLTRNGFKDATTDSAKIEAWRQKWPHCDFGWAVPAGVVVVDIDVKHGKRGYDDFRRLAGCGSRDVLTPQCTTPSGGAMLFYAASTPYKNAVAIDGTGIDTRTEGGYVVLPGPGNGRQWLRELVGADGVMAQLLPAPAWLDVALRKAPLVLAPRAALAPASDSWAQKKALSELEKACVRIIAAPCGAQDATRHAMCFYIGGIVARGDLDYVTAYAALLAAAQSMPAYRDSWRNLESRVARSLEAGMARPLALSETEAWIREFRARMGTRRSAPTTMVTPVTLVGANIWRRRSP